MIFLSFENIINKNRLSSPYLVGMLFLFSISFISCKQGVSPIAIKEHSFIDEEHRPQLHFTPKTGWMNDPNGMVYFNGTYHLFYQYYPDSTVWGPMHWGHATSADLVHWKHLPIAIFPDSLGWIFSGSAVYDQKNTSGLGKNGKGPLVAIYTHHSAPIEKTGSDLYQYQSIAFSNDEGETWTSYGGNPVLDNPGIRDFRDPKVIWHAPTQRWVMVLAALNKLMFYSSPNLIDWSFLSEFGENTGSHDGVWECPDLFPLVDENGENHWVLLVNMNPGNPNGGSGTQYFIGDFDGEYFTIDPKFSKLLHPIAAYVPEGKIFEDFENGMSRWSSEGTAFSIAKYKIGKSKILTSSANGFSEKDVAISTEFMIEHNAINFQIAGGNHRGKTSIVLEVDGRTIREAEGNNTDNLIWKGWDVSTYLGKKARLKIIDNHTGDWGYIGVDNITFADEVAHGDITGSVWLDSGADNYAGVTWSNVPDSDGRRIFIGWMSNWAYAQVVPTKNWRSAMALPWELFVRNVDGVPRLMGRPVGELQKLRGETFSEIVVAKKNILPDNGLAEIDWISDSNKNLIIEFGNEIGEKIVFTYDATSSIFELDRTQSGNVDFNPDFKRKHIGQRISSDENVAIRIFLDHSSLEIFADNGSTIFTELYFPGEKYTYVQITGEGMGEIHSLLNIWR